MKNSWNKVVALMLATVLCVSCGVTGFAEDTQTNENTEIVEVVEQQMQEEPPKEEAPAPEPVKEPEPAPVQEEPKAEPAPEAPKAEPAPVQDEPKVEAPKAEEPKAEEPKQEEETKADEKTEVKIEEKAEEPEQKVEESAEQKQEEIKADETKKEEETKAEEKSEEPKAEESKEEPKTEEKPVEQPTVPAAAKVEQPVEDLSAADEVKKENITVHIEWADEDNALGLRPQTLAVILNGSDGQTYSATVAEKDGWQHTFADLTIQRGAEVIYYAVDADDATDYDKDVRGLTVTYTCTAKPVVDNEPVAEDENLIDDQMDGEPDELPEGGLPTVTETEDGTVIDMGETAEAPVEGEEANADKPEEDGELDEDFTLPEEGELPEEDAEPEVPEIPEIDFSTLSVAISAESDVVELGGDMVLTAVLTGFEDLNYTLQWQFSADNANWADVDGATGSTLRVQMNEENRDYFWRVSVDNISWKNPPVVQTEPTLEAAEPAAAVEPAAAAEPVEPAEAAETGAQE